jgi:hypothetical protein
VYGLSFLVQPAYLKRGKLEIKHVLPSDLYRGARDLDTGLQEHMVVVAQERAPESIASHLWRYLYARAVEYQTGVRAAIAALRTAQEARAGVAARLAAAAGGRLVATRPVGDQQDALVRDADGVEGWPGGGQVAGRVGPDGVSLEMRRLSPDQAERVVRALFGGAETA